MRFNADQPATQPAPGRHAWAQIYPLTTAQRAMRETLTQATRARVEARAAGRPTTTHTGQ